MRNCNYIGNPPMFHSRVRGVGSMGPRPVDPTETTFVARGKIWETRTFDHPTYGKQTINYETQVTVKNYVPGSGQVSYTTWGDGLYPGFNPTPNWKTVSETEFISMYPDWVAVRNSKFGMTSPDPTVPPSQRPPTIPMVEPATGGSALPLVIGAALLLLS